VGSGFLGILISLNDFIHYILLVAEIINFFEPKMVGVECSGLEGYAALQITRRTM
jgi:hypothetical protein